MDFEISCSPVYVASDEELQQTIRLMLRQRLLVWGGLFIGDLPVFVETQTSRLVVPNHATLLADASSLEEEASKEWESELFTLMFLVDELVTDEHASNIFVDKFDAFRTGFQLGRATHTWQVNHV
jgi:hypothetical protein